MKKFDVIAIGELNVDVILNKINGEPEIGKEKIAEELTLTLGSSTAIFAANIATLGSKTGFIGKIGNDIFGDLIEKELREKGVDTSMLIKSNTHASGATICINYKEDRANITFLGAMNFMSFSDINKDIFHHTRHIHLSSIFMQSGIKKDIQKILKYAYDNNITTSLDTQWDPHEKWDFDYKNILPYVKVFLPNETELKLITRSHTLNEATKKIMPLIDICAVKCGKRGSFLLEKNKKIRYLKAFQNDDVVDAIGAGDSFNAGFIHAIINDATPVEAQFAGNLAGAINTTASGGTSAFNTKEEIKKIAKKMFYQEFKI